VLSVIIENRLL
jgi:hypothetical protein